MKRVFIASVAAVALSASSAFAADLPPASAPYYKAPPMAPSYSWTGCYIDGGAGYGMSNTDETISGPGVATAKVTDGGRGWLGRVGAGCDYQLGGGFSNWVIGAFGDYDFENIHGWNDFGSLALTGEEKQNDAWAAGGRLGYLVTPRLLTYVDGGYTEAHVHSVTYTSILGAPGAITTPSHTYNGWFLGGGTEYALDFSWLPIHGLFWRNEYRYSDFSGASLPATGPIVAGVTLNEKKFEQTITSSLVWRFNWNGR